MPMLSQAKSTQIVAKTYTIRKIITRQKNMIKEMIQLNELQRRSDTKLLKNIYI
jgi:hypothetical protein